MLIRDRKPMFSPDEGSPGSGESSAWDALDAPYEGDDGAGGGEQPQAPNVAPQAQQQAPDPLEDEKVWERLQSHPRIQAAFKQFEQQIHGQMRTFAEKTGLWEEMNKRAAALRENNPYWTEKKVQEVAAQQTQTAHKDDPMGQIARRLEGLEKRVQMEAQAKMKEVQSRTEQQVVEDIRKAVKEAGLGPVDKAEYIEDMQEYMVRMALRDIQGGKERRSWADYTKEAHARLSGHFGSSQPRMPQTKTIPPTGAAPGMDKKAYLEAREEQLWNEFEAGAK